MPDYTELVEQRSQEGYRYAATDIYSLAAGESSLSIQAQGGFITAGELIDARGELVPVFYSGGDLRSAKLRASHFASPMGQSEELGRQHGWPRWTDWEAEVQKTARGSKAVLHAKTPPEYFQLERIIDLRPHEAVFTNFLKLGRGQEAWEGSAGEHYYFNMSGGKSEGLKVSFPALTPGAPAVEPLKDTGIFEQVMAGSSHFCPEFNGTAAVAFPDGKKLIITSRAEIEDYPGALPRLLPKDLLGMLLWRSPSNQDSFCAEPTLGIVERDGHIDNRALHLSPGALVIMTTSVRITA